jgi:hypothetical protein
MKLDRQISLRDLFEFTPDIPGKIRLRAIFANDYEAFASAVEDAVEWAAGEMQRNPQAKQNLNEDQLTLEIITSLRAMSFNASHDTMIGGHGDIIVEGKNSYLWIGEAKIYGTYGWLLAGFDQLSTRYSTGSNGETRGGLIIYIKAPSINKIMSEWRVKLKADRSCVNIDDCTKNPLAFFSRHPHQRTGLDFRIRHIPVALHYAPAPKPPPMRKRSVA